MMLDRFRFGGLFDRLLAPGLLESLEFPLCPGKRTFQAGFRLPEPVQQRDLVFGAELLYQETCLAYLHAPQFPLRDCHLFAIEPFGPGLRLPFGFLILAELLKCFRLLAGQHDGVGAQSVTEAVQLNRFALGSPRASRL